MMELLDVVKLLAAAIVALLGNHGIQYWRAQRTARSEAALPPPAQPHWTDLTGEQRPVTHGECNLRHQQLQRDLDKGEERWAEMQRGIQAIREQLAQMNGSL
ncbi:MAG: hypothetical protein GTN69_12410, partial [Armatimonadetes bacterium]|nr:hypothetical protein [Armatimonadota bacterium]